MSELPAFLLCCVACRSWQGLLTGRRDVDGVWLVMRCVRCGATQHAGPLAMEQDPVSDDHHACRRERHEEVEWNLAC